MITYISIVKNIIELEMSPGCRQFRCVEEHNKIENKIDPYLCYDGVVLIESNKKQRSLEFFRLESKS